ncbi:Pyruvate kinase [Phytophthora palmivora]|uniref:Pyruvate kinase n=1 Tax=Phytophthora palmivora TaxID=4796 RepID=A0A2P4XBK2_9STRA|nr:Pyruvate kinase [Phytophthora palmivora]
MGETCKINNTEEIGNRKGVNLPGLIVELPALSDKDKRDLDWGTLTLSRPRSVIISKVENLKGIQNFEEILEALDGVMYARGDLSVEVPDQKVQTRTGYTACKVVKYKPTVPVMCFTTGLKVGRQLQIHHGLYPVVPGYLNLATTTAEAIAQAVWSEASVLYLTKFRMQYRCSV